MDSASFTNQVNKTSLLECQTFKNALNDILCYVNLTTIKKIKIDQKQQCVANSRIYLPEQKLLLLQLFSRELCPHFKVICLSCYFISFRCLLLTFNKEDQDLTLLNTHTLIIWEIRESAPYIDFSNTLLFPDISFTSFFTAAQC